MLQDKQNQAIYLKQILDNSPDGMFTINMEMAIQYVNPAFCKLLGYPESELIGTPITQHLGDLDILGTCMAEVSTNGKCNDQETIFKRKNGSMVHISKNVQAICDEKGNFSELLVSIRDLTNLHKLNQDLEHSLSELQRTQEQLIESEKMASLGSMVAGVAHEINTPLGISITSASSITSELEAFRHKFESGTIKKSDMEVFINHAELGCRILNENLKRAADLVNSFKQVAVDQTADDWRRINLHQYCDEILTSIGPKFRNRPIAVFNKTPQDIDLETNPGSIYQIISNLIINSLVHAFDEDSEGQISIEAREEGNRLLIDYRDNGKGIPAENLKRIFEPFFTTKRGQGGSGLGLSIIYNLVTSNLKGTLDVHSEVGTGTHFCISLPVSEKAVA